MERFTHWITDHPWFVIVLSVISTIISIYGIKFFHLNNDPEMYFDPADPDFIQYKVLENHYEAFENVLFVLDFGEENVFTDKNLKLVRNLTEDSWEMYRALRVDSIANFQHTTVDGDELFTQDLIPGGDEETELDIENIKHIALTDRALKRRMISKTGNVVSVSVTVNAEDHAEKAPDIMKSARELRDRYQEMYPDVRFLISGTVAFFNATNEATNRSLVTTLPASFIAVVLCIMIMLRSFTGMLLTMSIVTLSVMSAMGLACWFGNDWSPIAGISLTMVLTLAVADCIHVLVSFSQKRSEGMEKISAIIESIRINFSPIFLTSITTIIGFLMLNFSSAEPLHIMGNVTAMGVTVAFLYSVTTLPAMLAVLPSKEVHAGALRSQAMGKLADFVIKYNHKILTAMTILIIGILACIPLNVIDDVFSEYFDETFEFRVANDFAMEHLSGMHRIEFDLPAKEAGGVMEPEYLEALNELVTWVESQPNVLFASSYIDVIKRLNQNMHQDNPAFYTIPDSRELASQYTLMYEMSLPMNLGIDNQVEFNKSFSRVTIVMENVGSQGVIEMASQVNDWIEGNLPEYMHSRGTGMDILFGQITMNNINQMLGGTALALCLISLLLVIALRSWRYGALSMLPNLLPALMAFGVWGVVSGNVDFSVSIVAAMTLGIVVDDTVHFLSKYIRAKREMNLSPAEAVRYSFSTVGIALITTSVVLMVNFGIIGMSNFHPSQSMGVLTAITIVVALVVNFMFFIPLLYMLDQRKHEKRNMS